VRLAGALLLLGLAPLARAAQGDAALESRCTPSEVHIGEPFTLQVDVLHDEDTRVLLDPPRVLSADELGDIELGDRWVLLEDRSVVSLPIEGEPGRILTRARWRLLGLEPGAHELLAIGADTIRSGASARLEAAPVILNVLPELAEGEDEARALLGFREDAPVIAGPLDPLFGLARGALLAGIALWLGLAVFAIGLALVLRKRGRRAARDEPTALERLAAIDPADPEGAREGYFRLSRVVREELDQRAGGSLEGLTDEEWIARRREGNVLPAAQLERAAKLLRACEEVKYGAGMPTRWAVEEALAEARELCSAGASEGERR